MPRIRWTATTDKLDATDGVVKARIRALYTAIGGLVPYDMGGAMAASTTVTPPAGASQAYVTRDTRHSEMVAIQDMLRNGQWVRQAGGNLTWAAGAPITAAQFATNAPHCGYCTLTLRLLGLPLGAPTKGNYNLANNYNYLLPDPLARDPRMIVAYRSAAAYADALFKQLLNLLVNNAPQDWVLQLAGGAFVDDNGPLAVAPAGATAIMPWADAVDEERMRKFRTQIWRCIYEVNRE